MTEKLLGKPVAQSIKEDLAARIEKLGEQDVVPGLAIIRVGEREDDVTYEASLTKAARALGITVNLVGLDDDVEESVLIDAIHSVNVANSLHGCLMFRPLPKRFDSFRICNELVPEKDVDGMGADSLAGIFMGTDVGYAPATAQACIKLLDFYGIDVTGKNIVVVGRSLVIGRPVAMMLLGKDATVTLCHSKTQDLQTLMKDADIVVCASGRPKAFGDGCFKEGQIVIDVGMNVDENGNLCGDADDLHMDGVVEGYTPVPGGIGAITTAVLLEHVVRSAELASTSSASGLS